MSETSDAGRGFLVGDLCIDLILHMPEEPGNARQVPAPEVHGGGTVANTAVALARLSVETRFAGVAGDDLFGRQAVQELADEGIDVSCVEFSAVNPTMVVIAMIDGSGERTVTGWPRRNQAFTDLHKDQVLRLDLRPADWMHVSGVCLVQESARQATLAALELARTRRARSSLDLNLRLGLEGDRLPSDYADTVWEAIRRAEYVLGSADEELPHLIPDPPDVRAATALLAERGQCTAIMHEGPAGAHVSVRGAPAFTIPACDVPVVDTLGAGDAFAAGFMFAGLEGMPLGRQVELAHAVAGLQIGGTGARSSPTLSELKVFMERRRL